MTVRPGHAAFVCLLLASCGADAASTGGLADAGQSDVNERPVDTSVAPDRAMTVDSAVHSDMLITTDGGVRRDAPPASTDVVSSTLTPTISMPGPLLFQDNFNEATLPRTWRDNKGNWTVETGAIRGTEIPAESHPALAVHDMALRDFIIELKFQLDGSDGLWLMINKAGPEHNCRILIRPNLLGVYRTTGIGPTTSNTALGTKRVTLDRKRWYTMLVEVVGNQMVAQLDNGDTARGTASSGIDVDHTTLGLVVDNGSALFDDVRVWTAVPR